MTEWGCIVPYVKEGSKVFIHGGSGGTGTFGIQIAKALGCHVTTSCSTGNVSLCKSIGADEVIDYKTANVSEELKKKGQVFDLVVDNVGDPNDLYIAANTFLKSTGKFNLVGFQMSLAGIASTASRMLWPGFLGGGKRSLVIAMVQNEYNAYVQLGKWMQEGKLKAVIDSTYEYSDAPKAFERLKTGHAKGKVVVHVTKKPEY
jgi:alkaline phosphatase D